MIQAMKQNRPDFGVQYIRQNEWIEGRGILLWLSMFFIELGAGVFLVASIFGSLLGMLVGWLLCGVLGGGLHLLFLTHPFRSWRILFSSGWKRSWISRGLIFVLLFLSLGLIHIILYQLASPAPGLLIVANVFAFLTIIYAGFLMASFNSIPLWNTPMLPALYVILGIWGGFGITLISLLATGPTVAVDIVERWLKIFLMAFIFVVFVYLFSMRFQGTTGKFSVRQIVAGKWAPLFWIVVVVLGMALPAGVALSSWLVDLVIPGGFLYIVITFELLGDLALRYCIFKCGVYAPFIPVNSPA